MADLRFQSLHLEGLPRREDFRAARARLEASCGLRTLSGDLSDPSPIDPGDGATAVFDIALGQRYFVQDGEKLHPLLIGVNSIGRLPDNTVTTNVLEAACLLTAKLDEIEKVCDEQALDGKAHAARGVACEDVAEVSGRHGEIDAAPGSTERHRRGKVINRLRDDTRPVDRIDAGERHRITESVMIEHSLHQRLTIVESAIDR